MSLSTTIKSIQDIMRKDSGVDGDAQRISQLVWMILLKVFDAKEEGVERLATETGAGQWGSAVSLACAYFGIEAMVYMVRISYEQKQYRGTLMRTYGADIVPSPSDRTDYGRKVRKENPDHPGTLGIAISEAIEDTVKHENTKYTLGSVLNFVMLHQSVIGAEITFIGATPP